MDGGESPLDVLSRAATMLQEHQQSPLEDTSKQASKQLPTAKWKRDRRSRPEYLRKSDPKIPEGFLPEPPAQAEVSTSDHAHTNNGHNVDTPLDMSVRQRGQPPSYAQAISTGYRAGFRPSVIAQAPQRDEMPSGISMCDPIIDEHFRRSLGKDYVKIFANNNVPKDGSVTAADNKTNGTGERTDNSGMLVDDHFAKALGDTWLQLNKKERDLESNGKDAVSV